MWDKNFLDKIDNATEVASLVAQNPFSIILEELWEKQSMFQCAWEGGHLVNPTETVEVKEGSDFSRKGFDYYFKDTLVKMLIE